MSFKYIEKIIRKHNITIIVLDDYFPEIKSYLDKKNIIFSDIMTKNCLFISYSWHENCDCVCIKINKHDNDIFVY
jgi:hypothetical protein